MTINPCGDKAIFTEQTLTEGANLYTKATQQPVATGHMLALPLT